jgi:hypothetical protein
MSVCSAEMYTARQKHQMLCYKPSLQSKASLLKEPATYNFDSKLIFYFFSLQLTRCKLATRKMVKVAIAGGSGSRLSRREMPYVQPC